MPALVPHTYSPQTGAPVGDVTLWVQAVQDGIRVRGQLGGVHHHLVELAHGAQEVLRARALEGAPPARPAPVAVHQHVVQVQHQRAHMPGADGVMLLRARACADCASCTAGSTELRQGITKALPWPLCSAPVLGLEEAIQHLAWGGSSGSSASEGGSEYFLISSSKCRRLSTYHPMTEVHACTARAHAGIVMAKEPAVVLPTVQCHTRSVTR